MSESGAIDFSSPGESYSKLHHLEDREPVLTGASLLLVDDKPELLNSLYQLISLRGYRADTALGGQQTLNLLAVRYRYNSQQQQLLYQQQPYHSGKKPNWTDSWHTVSGKIASVSILCFDGKKWHDQWNYQKEKTLRAKGYFTYKDTTILHDPYNILV
ncbi:MAG: hypothetical protein IH908_14930 [Proteobacteria bacterium]|nr:hypothetical protein [Pseudomonadota bacterium]